MTLKEFDRIGMGERIRISREKHIFPESNSQSLWMLHLSFSLTSNAATEVSLCQNSHCSSKS